MKNELNMCIVLPKDVAVDLHMQIFVGHENS